VLDAWWCALAQVAAFFRVRQLAMTQPFPMVEDCLKGLYLT